MKCLICDGARMLVRHSGKPWPSDVDPQSDLVQRLQVERVACFACDGTGQQRHKCERCDGCGRIASTKEGEPWQWWQRIANESAPGSELARQIALIHPIDCPACGGTGVRIEKGAPVEPALTE